MPSLRGSALLLVVTLFAFSAPLAGQAGALDSALRVVERFAPQVDSVRRAAASAVLLVAVEHNGTVVRGAAFPLRDSRLGNPLSVVNCFPEIALERIESTLVAKVAGGPGPLRPDWTYLLYAKLKQLPTGEPLPPKADCGRR